MDEEFQRRLEAAIDLQHGGDNEGAAAAFLSMFDAYPDDRLADEAGNIYLYALEDAKRAIPCFERAASVADDPTELHFKIGFAFASSGDDEQASSWFARVHELAPTHPGTFLEVAKLCMRRGDHSDAVEYLQTAWAHHVMESALMGGPNAHFQALVLVNQARARLLHLDQVDEGIRHVASLMSELGDSERCESLAQELDEAGKGELARRVRSVIEAG